MHSDGVTSHGALLRECTGHDLISIWVKTQQIGVLFHSPNENLWCSTDAYKHIFCQTFLQVHPHDAGHCLFADAMVF